MELKAIPSPPRLRVLQGWLAIVALIVVTGVEFGIDVSTRSMAMLLALCLVPSTFISLLWPAVRTAENSERAPGSRGGA